MHRDEITNRLLLLVIGVLAGLIVFISRTKTPNVVPLQWVTFQYLLVFVLLGMLPMLRLRATTPAGRAVTEFLIVMILVVVTLQPEDLVLNGLIALTVCFGSIAYFRFYRGSVPQFIVLVWLLLVELWVFSLGTLQEWYQVTQDFRFLFGMVFVTVVLLALSRMLLREFQNTTKMSFDLGGLKSRLMN